MAAKKKQKTENKNYFYDDSNLTLEIQGAGIVYSLVKTDKKTGESKKVFVDGNTNLLKFTADCSQYIPKEKE